eukprot:TCALIF_08484-PA protein Name:"Protein of unknown function" AED:0.24 eAED:0.29 QI:0/-1/0/1/-1/1/1/0/295
MAGVFASALYGSDGNPGPTTGASANGYSQAATNAVSARLPRFLDFNPELWFAQCEAVFELSRITAERTKFNHCVSCLEPEVLRKVQAVIRAPDPDAPYSSFKEALLRATTKSLPQRVQEVMDLRLGDRRPSDLLHLMEESWPEGEADGSPVFRQLFLQKLPPSLQPALASCVESLTDLALLADTQVATLRNLGLQSGQAANSALTGVVAPALDAGPETFFEGSSLAQDVLATGQQKQWRGRQQRFQPRRSPSHRAGELCWYHARYAGRAKKCNGMGCSWSRGAENGEGAHQPYQR